MSNDQEYIDKLLDEDNGGIQRINSGNELSGGNCMFDIQEATDIPQKQLKEMRKDIHDYQPDDQIRIDDWNEFEFMAINTGIVDVDEDDDVPDDVPTLNIPTSPATSDDDHILEAFRYQIFDEATSDDEYHDLVRQIIPNDAAYANSDNEEDYDGDDDSNHANGYTTDTELNYDYEDSTFEDEDDVKVEVEGDSEVEGEGEGDCDCDCDDDGEDNGEGEGNREHTNEN